jgi:hypothetical protein
MCQSSKRRQDGGTSNSVIEEINLQLALLKLLTQSRANLKRSLLKEKEIIQFAAISCSKFRHIRFAALKYI